MKEKLIGFKATIEEYELLNRYATAIGETKSNVMREAMLKYIKGEI